MLFERVVLSSKFWQVVRLELATRQQIGILWRFLPDYWSTCSDSCGTLISGVSSIILDINQTCDQTNLCNIWWWIMNDESRKQETNLKRKRLRRLQGNRQRNTKTRSRRLQDILRHINRIYESENADGQNHIIQELNDLVGTFSIENAEGR